MPYIRYSPADHRDDGRGIGTSLPEIIVSYTSYTVHRFGRRRGARFFITNILLILGLAALVRPFTVLHSDVLRRSTINVIC